MPHTDTVTYFTMGLGILGRHPRGAQLNLFFGKQNVEEENPGELCGKETRSLFPWAGKCTSREVAFSRAKFSSALLMSFKLLQTQTAQEGRKRQLGPLTRTATTDRHVNVVFRGPRAHDLIADRPEMGADPTGHRLAK